MKYKDILFNTIISAMIGCVVGVIGIIMNPGINIPWLLISNSIVGIIIGTISGFAFYYIYEKKRLGIKAALWAIFIVVFVMISGLALCNGIKEFPWFMFLVVLPIVEFLSLSYCYIDYKMSIKYNQKLHDKKEQVLKNKRKMFSKRP